MQMNTDVEILLELPDKYLRSESRRARPMMRGGIDVPASTATRPMQPAARVACAGGGMVIRMGGPGGPRRHAGEKPTPEQQAQIDKAIVRASRTEISRLMLGWFASAHPSLSAQYTYAGEAESPDGKATSSTSRTPTASPRGCSSIGRHTCR